MTTVTLEQFSSWVGHIYGAALEPGFGAEDNLRRGCFPWIETLPDSDRQQLSQLLRSHQQQAQKIHYRFAALSDQCEDLMALLHHAKYGALLTTVDARVLFANSVARELLDKKDSVFIRAGELHSKHLSEQLALHNLIGAAAHKNARGIRQGGSLTLSRPLGQRALAVHVLPVGDDAPDRCFPVLVLIVDPDGDPRPQLTTLRTLYGLTKAEAAVAIRVTQGERLQVVADALAISLSTARIHLQRVFEKTGTHRQAELVRLLLTVQAGINMPGG
ncbi:helix-turn-helix transcriptional regulator [Cellvibrio japonicus]|uniref:Transcriptional regulator, LuxR family n=1 Tax=Cellvibrio japonicus (strain Ueda107) TaxID=498211 RepID=B3PI03_CELJU|nr:LuxR C-terminal-related transcriptional regulator [Cellvibrio japonicus]ACE85058.1 transcriptional regulator, LuxR family [Cellvibrio japonicus Ueda107]QEI13936.1 helix-turn-helix transcriptional regulator [Cellvibrio japonicus]QEI17510.1 helix-turn-helix transcriptional regulator [Cellvibrio japonicus]QEI21086.1 helix-turn-helix transcriptional regulator [Cellvibrio japonicus]